ncbi:serine hydrolase [Streptomyces sp. NPDC050418]|uniref:serine hydrolase n=1 Tax=Streptomyces sp. NPDC050418 TaxID=3365612 RepID=UPI00378A7E65
MDLHIRTRRAVVRHGIRRRHSAVRHWRPAVAAAVASALIAPISAVSAEAAVRRGAPVAPLAPACRSPRDPGLAARMSKDIRAALSSREGTVSVAVHDDDSDLWCALDAGRQYDAASVAKVLIMETVLWRAEQLRRKLTQFEARRVPPMIQVSDNAAAGQLWQDLAPWRVEQFLAKAKAASTTPGPGRLWGLTRTTAVDQMRLLGVLTQARSFLRSRAYGLKQLAQVRKDQRWGVTAGMANGVSAHIKNGWLPRATHGWRVHSIGAFKGDGRTYRIVVLSHDNPTMAYGVRTIERVAHAVHRALNKGRSAGQGYTPESEISEQPDGSVPDDAPEAPPQDPDRPGPSAP